MVVFRENFELRVITMTELRRVALAACPPVPWEPSTYCNEPFCGRLHPFGPAGNDAPQRKRNRLAPLVVTVEFRFIIEPTPVVDGD